MVARYLGVVEAVGSNPATQTKKEGLAFLFSFNINFQYTIENNV